MFSAYPENYGISSILADDLDFKEQSVEKHLEQAKFLDIKYFVVISSQIKEKLSRSGLTETKLGAWSVFEITRNSLLHSQNLIYKPALILSDFSLKARKSDDLSFTRFAEEQFNDAWFDVLLVHNPHNNKIDKLSGLENFGTMIIEKYDYDDEDKAFDILKTYSQKNSVILFDLENDLLKRIKASIAEFGNLKIIRYPIEPESFQLNNEFAGNRYNSSEIRFVWKQIKQYLESHKIKADSPIPILAKRTFHPNRQNSIEDYISTPFFTVSFAPEVEVPAFRRDFLEIFAFGLSIFLLFVCLLLTFVTTEIRT